MTVCQIVVLIANSGFSTQQSDAEETISAAQMESHLAGHRLTSAEEFEIRKSIF